MLAKAACSPCFPQDQSQHRYSAVVIKGLHLMPPNTGCYRVFPSKSSGVRWLPSPLPATIVSPAVLGGNGDASCWKVSGLQIDRGWKNAKIPLDQLSLNPNRRDIGMVCNTTPWISVHLVWFSVVGKWVSIRRKMQCQPKSLRKSLGRGYLSVTGTHIRRFYPHLGLLGERLLYSLNQFYCTPTTSIPLTARLLCARYFSG